MSVTFSHSLIGWIIIGLLAGWLAGTLSRGRGFLVGLRSGRSTRLEERMAASRP